MKKYLLTIEEINKLPRYHTPNNIGAFLGILEIERALMLQGIKPFPIEPFNHGFINGFKAGGRTIQALKEGALKLEDNNINFNLKPVKMNKENLRVYLATQPGCEPCEVTRRALNIHNSKGYIMGVDIHEVNLNSTEEGSMARAKAMGVTSTPTLFIVTGSDTDGNGIWEESEEVRVHTQVGTISSPSELYNTLDSILTGVPLSTPLDNA